MDKPLDLSALKIFSSTAYVHVPDEDRKKLDTKTTRGIFVGHDMESKAYRIYDPQRRKVVISRDVAIDETSVGFQHLTVLQPDKLPGFITNITLRNASHNAKSQNIQTDHYSAVNVQPVLDVSLPHHGLSTATDSTINVNNGAQEPSSFNADTPTSPGLSPDHQVSDTSTWTSRP